MPLGSLPCFVYSINSFSALAQTGIYPQTNPTKSPFSLSCFFIHRFASFQFHDFIIFLGSFPSLAFFAKTPLLPWMRAVILTPMQLIKHCGSLQRKIFIFLRCEGTMPANRGADQIRCCAGRTEMLAERGAP